MTDFYGFTEVSGNGKTGKITVTKSNSRTCPPSCGMFFDCYAKFHHLGGHWKKLDKGEGKAYTWPQLLSMIRTLASDLWRHDEMGDLPGQGNEIDASRLTQLVKANGRKRGFTYTHKPVFAGAYKVTGKPGQENAGEVSEETASNNRAAIAEANAKGFTVNLSADDLSEADAMAGLGIAPVTTVLPMDAETGKKYATPEGRKVVTCPAAIKGASITCKTCKLCAIPTRKSIIGFPAHGAGKKRASLRIVG